MPLGDLLDSTFIVLGHKTKEKEIEVQSYQGPTLPMISCQTGRINQALTFLLSHLIDNIPLGGRLEVHGEVKQDDIWLTFHSPNTQALLSASEGASSPQWQYAKEIIAEHRGEIQYPYNESGTSVQLQFPIAHF